MRGAWTIMRREVFSYFVSPVAYVVLTAWLLYAGITFGVLCGLFAGAPSLSASSNPLSAFFGGSVLFFIPLWVFAPVMTMRLLAEEKRTGTIECLLTAPVTTGAVVLGKYAAALIFWCALWVPTLLYVWITSQFGDVDPGAVAASYLGVFGIGVYYMAVGLAMSAVTQNQIVAALLTFAILAGQFTLGLGTFVDYVAEYKDVFEYISLWGCMQAFSKGIVDTRYLVFDATMAVLFMYLAWRVLEGRRVA